MTELLALYIFLIAVFIISTTSSSSDYEFRNSMKIAPEARVVLLNYDTTLICEMNVNPDIYRWKFYPLKSSEVYNEDAEIDLDDPNFHYLIPNETTKKSQSQLDIRVNKTGIAGDYQCLAYYGASVHASVPWRITIATLDDFPRQKNDELTVAPGNTINWKCNSPKSNPKPWIDYYKNENYNTTIESSSKQSLILSNVNYTNSGTYRCVVTNVFFPNKIKSEAMLTLRVDRSIRPQKPYYIQTLKETYTVVKGETVLLECSAIGNPVPRTTWQKIDGAIDEKRTRMLPEGLRLDNVQHEDNGSFVCTNRNSEGETKLEIRLLVNSPPSINCTEREIQINQDQNLNLECHVSGSPKPKISWFLNGFSVKNDTTIETNKNEIIFRRVEKRHAGNLQIFARNIVDTVYRSVSLRVVPKTKSIEEVAMPTSTRRPHRASSKFTKRNRMIPPRKPNITRVKEDTVMVRWSVKNEGLPIKFFKVQYQEQGKNGTRRHWQTSYDEIANHTFNYDVTGLKPDSYYQFRVAAVYSNDDNKLSSISAKFHLKKDVFDDYKKLPIPLITSTEAIDTTTVRIYWKTPIANVTVKGFYVNYNSASSAGDYSKVPVDESNCTSYILMHLQPDTVYDIKLQSFNQETASDFSATAKVKTTAEIGTTVELETETPPVVENTGFSKFYIIIASGIIVGGGCLVLVVALLVFCRKWKQKKNNNRQDRDKPAVEEHHIQADVNEYVVGPKGSLPRSNGLPTNRITITPNPLADADNKNQNMIEMSCLSSQNNNTTGRGGGGGGGSQGGSSCPPPSNAHSNNERKNRSHREKLGKNKHNIDVNSMTKTTSGENYV